MESNANFGHSTGLNFSLFHPFDFKLVSILLFRCLMIGRRLLFFISLWWLAPSAQGEISHLELGAANYEMAYGHHPKRFLVLELTAVDLIKTYGSEGVIYLNDFHEDSLEMAAEHLRSWLIQKGYQNIKVKTLPGDYHFIDIPYVKSAHLSNPDARQFPTCEHPEVNQLITDRLELIANRSESGLRITTDLTAGKEDCVADLKKNLSQRAEINLISESGYPYYFPDGKSLDEKKMGVPSALQVENTQTKTFQLVVKKNSCERPLL